MASQEKRKKVLVSGCFDLLHSGHVKFFEEASKLGDLYVCLGTDANVQMLKHHTTMFPNEERLYMVQAIKYVHHARFSSGTGDIDFEPDLDEIKPDIFYVNEDGDREAKRVVIKKRGITYHVAKRTPQEGLKARSSTQLKLDLKEKKAKKKKDNEPVDPVKQFKKQVTDKLLEIKRDVLQKESVGKQRDAHIVNKLNEIKREVEEADRNSKQKENEVKEFKNTVVQKLLEIKQDVSKLESAKRLNTITERKENDENRSQEEKFPWRLCVAGGWLDQPWVSEVMRGGVIVMNVEYNAHFKDRAGLATSSRKTAMKLWQNGRLPSDIDNVEAAKLLFGAENTPGNKYVSGSQDQLGLLLPGINRLDYKGEYWPNYMISMKEEAKQRGKNIKEIYAFVEKVLWLIPVKSLRIDGYSPLEEKALTEDNVEKLADASEKCWKGILNCDAENFGVGLTETLKAWKLILPLTVPPELDPIWQKYDKANYGCLFTGCAGGFLMVVAKSKPDEKAFQVKIQDKDWWKEI
mmetsp:Transcript_24450/g.21368  ORF Transcript_24450/g.21368 Transcript_24450/m.21368 type:complete len:520 (+) Transcript_24450:27-1586(+)|eukprot:CAMPEP_0201581376 /NCGR_PEP_ID=MMETSP0190_2-20130828/66921_1 /ASSEMBLY_ACC=CAM_ASM_000263 /TAXON_ID=37353 /ORGANISM="Rosalina sp." /LENGTH=519 /DNA_ID=CAMNT_0048019159 /DNA_START=1 /DNA_END=1560 /DNA_ORIENTATION=+